MGESIDFALLDKQINKIKNQINLETNVIPLIDKDCNNMKRDWLQEQQDRHSLLRAEMSQKLEELKLFVPTDAIGYDTVAGLQPDRCSLLSQIAGQFFQCIPVYEDE